MQRLTKVIAAAALCFLGATLGRAGQTADSLIKKVESRYNRAKTLSVEFVEHYSILGRSRPPEAGHLTLRKQGKMRWDYTRPAGKVFVSDGKTVFLYTAADNRVEKIPMKETEDMRAPLAFLLGHLDMSKEFRNFETRADRRGEWLTAQAKNDRVPYKNIDMLIGTGGEIEELRVIGRDESTLWFSFSNERLNPPAPNDLFKFSIPPGAEVVDVIPSQVEAPE